MKRILFIGVVASLMVCNATAQTKQRTYVTEEWSNIDTTHISTVKQPKAAKDWYIRLYGGFALTMINPLKNYTTSPIADIVGEKEKYKPFCGLDLGWTFGKCITGDYVFVETGIAVTTGRINIANGNKNEQKTTLLAIADVEIPATIAFRFRVDNSNICISPYLGCHLKINAGYFGEIADNTTRVGFQVGLNFDFNHFYLGAGWDHDFTSLTSGGKTFTSGLRVRSGITF